MNAMNARVAYSDGSLLGIRRTRFGQFDTDDCVYNGRPEIGAFSRGAHMYETV
jgi:hypothetical protein